MAKLKVPNDWWTAPAEAENGQLILVTGRRGMQVIKETGFYKHRVEITWAYEPDAKGMPSFDDSKLMEQATDAFEAVFGKDPVAVNTGIYTGAGERNWVFYTRSLHIFQRKINEALADLPVLPLSFYAEEDPEWAEYAEMCEAEIAIGDEE